MAKNILTESTKSKFKVLEHKPKNVLKRIQGILSDFKSNRNGRIYPRELWENVLNSDYVKEMIESHGLVGELDHPEERLEISLQNVSHVINDMWIEGDSVMGTIDILPTPSGKIVSELIDYGTDIGISSRGAGSVGAGNIVDPDYQFVTFDFVARPSCEAARLNMIVESVQPEIDNNSDDKVKSILEGYKSSLKESKDIIDYNGYIILYDNDWKSYIILEKLNGPEELGSQIDKDDIRKLLRRKGNPYEQVLFDKVCELNGSGTAFKTVDGAKFVIDIIKSDFNNIYRGNYKEYLKKAKAIYKKSNLKENDFETYTDYSGERPIEKKRHTDDYCTIAAAEFTADRLPVNWRELPDDELEELVRQEVNTYNYANVEPEYENEDFYGDEANPEKVFNYIVNNYKKSVNESKRTLPYSEVGLAAFAISENFKDLNLDSLECFFYDLIDVLHLNENDFKLIAEMYGSTAGDLTKKLDKINGLNEAAMSDQEVYKTVLGWYKEQIEKGNMTLNQCYELLSDKAKVSLNKMVDQSKIKESLVNNTINKLIKESIELNKKN